MKRRPVPRRRRRGIRLDLLSIGLAPLGIAVIVVAQFLDGSPLAALLQASSALVVFGGTLAAILISYSPADVARSLRAAGRAFLRPDDDLDTMAATLVTLSVRGQRRGLPGLEDELDQLSDPFLREGLALVVDGIPADSLKDMLVHEAQAREIEEDTPARIFEAAAGYAPTMGILGAVLGLMRVMEHLSAPGTLGAGIALAFVATVYGVGSANLVFLPLAARLRERAAMQARRRELITQGLLALQQRLNPRLVAHKLRAYSSRVPRIDEISAAMPARPARPPRIPA